MKSKILSLLCILVLVGCTSKGIDSLASTSSQESSFVNTISSNIVSENSTNLSDLSSSSSFEDSSSSDVLDEIQMPENLKSYYSSVDFSLTGDALKEALDNLLDSTANNTFTYKNLFNVFIYSDVDPDNSSNMLGFYSGTSASKSEMNREHTWPNSRGGNALENDPHVIRPTLISENSARGNSFYNENVSWDPGTYNEKYRGIASRVIFYAAVKGQDLGLYLIDEEDDPKTSSGWNKSMGKLSTLLKWNLEYDIDQTEITRNEVLYEKFNHCRNPFIDNRDLACRIFGNYNENTLKVCSSK